MKASKEMQLRILDKMRENVESDRALYQDIQFNSCGEWYEKTDPQLDFGKIQYRIKPETITINGVEIPKSLSFKQLEELKTSNIKVFYPCLTASLYVEINTVSAFYDMNENTVCYETKEEAIEASKLLFGIKD